MSGRGSPSGGIVPVRTFRMTFSHTSAPAGTSATSMAWSESPCVRSLSLWQVTQYLPISARGASADEPEGVACCPVAAWVPEYAKGLEGFEKRLTTN